MKLTGYGVYDELELTEDAINEFTDGLENRGDFIRVYEIEHSIGGNVILSLSGANHLKGRMFEYEGLFVVICSDDEYIDIGVFRK